VASLLLALSDRLLGGTEPDPGPSRRWLLRYLGVAALLAAIIVARRPDAVTNPQFWAEDGYVFFYENLTLGFPRALAKMYLGFPYLAHRLIAFAGGLVPFALAPRVYTSSAIAITALGLATFALPGFRHLVRSDGLRVLFGIAAVSAPFDREVLSNLTNLGWFVAIWLSLLSVMRLPRLPWKVVLLGLLGSAAVFATPLATINLPLWLLRAWRAVRRSDRAEAGFAAALLAAWAAVVLMTRDLGAQGTLGFQRPGTMLLASPRGYLDKFACVVSYRVAVLVIPPGLMSRVDAAGTLALTAVGGAVLLALIAASAAGRFRNLAGLLLAVSLFSASYFILLLGRPKAFDFVECDRLIYRYTIYPAAMFSLALVTALDSLPRGRIRILACVGVLALLVPAWRETFVVPPFTDEHWARWVTILQHKMAARSHAQLVIPMNPPFAPLRFDAGPWLPEVDIPAETIIGSLGTHGMLRQSFVSRCNDLSAVQMRLGAPVLSTRGALTVSLLEEPTRDVVATTTMPRAEIVLDGGWEFFWFDPVRGSSGKRYTIVLRAVENDLDASVYVLGSREDSYPDGEAVFIGRQLPGDASFRYGCETPPAAP
jgi:hypothetical protein